MSRTILRESFVRKTQLDPQHLGFLASDMSPRQYYRIHKPKYVLMDAPPPENPQQFIKVATYLHDCGLHAPQIYAQDLEHGFILLEDLGDQTFTKILDADPTRETELFHLALDVLKHLRNTAVVRPDFVKAYDVAHKLSEAEVFIDWAWPAVYGTPVDDKVKQSYLNVWRDAYHQLPKTPNTLLLRDYHVDNLMVVDGKGVQKCGLLDFQDAMWGSVVYDFISLIEDARRDMSAVLTADLWQMFLKDFPTADHAAYRTAAIILGAGRHARVIGVFVRYAMCKSSPKYLCHLPRLWAYLDKAWSCPELKNVAQWFQTYFPLQKRQPLYVNT